MKINQKSKIKPVAIVAIIAGILVLGTGSVFAYQSFMNPKVKTDETNTSTEAVPSTPTTTPTVKGGQQNSSSDKGENENPSQPTNNTSISITSANQNGEVLQIRALIEAVWANGTCELILEKDGVIITENAAIQSLAASSTCQGFDVPTQELSPGLWSIRINAINGSTNINTTSQVTIQ